jgi:hypothetical protein
MLLLLSGLVRRGSMGYRVHLALVPDDTPETSARQCPIGPLDIADPKLYV